MNTKNAKLNEKTDFENGDFNGWFFTQGHQVIREENGNKFITTPDYTPSLRDFTLRKIFSKDLSGEYEISFDIFITKNLTVSTLQLKLDDILKLDLPASEKWITYKKTMKVQNQKINQLWIQLTGYNDIEANVRYDNITIRQL